MAAHWFPLKKSALLRILSGDVGLKLMSSWEFLRDNDRNLACKDLRFSTDPWLLVTRPPYLRCHPLPVQFGRSAGWYRLIGSGLMYAVLFMVWKQPLTHTFSVGMERDLGAYGAVESWETDGHKKNQETLTVTMTRKEKEASFRSTFWTGPWKSENHVSEQEKFSVKEEPGSAGKAKRSALEPQFSQWVCGRSQLLTPEMTTVVSNFAFLLQVDRTLSIWTSISLLCGSGSSSGLLTLLLFWAWLETGCGWYLRKQRKRWGWGCVEAASGKGLVYVLLKNT